MAAMPSVPYGLNLAAADFSLAAEDEFNDWYDTEHIPERSFEGMLGIHRWIGVDNPRLSIASYDMQSVAVRESAPYKAISAHQTPWSVRLHRQLKQVCHFVAEQVLPGQAAAVEGAGALLLHAVNLPAKAEADFIAWRAGELFPRLARVPGCLTARAFLVKRGVQRHLQLFQLDSPAVCEAAAWQEAFATPAARRMQALFTDELRLLARAYARPDQV